MRRTVLPIATSLLMTAAGPALSQQQQQMQRPPAQSAQPHAPRQQQQQQQVRPPQAPPKPYKPVAVGAPPEMKDPSLDAFRKQLADIAGRKDRNALAKIVARDFFWLGQKGDRADKKRSGGDNLARALSLDAKEGFGWEALAGFASNPTAMPIPIRKNTFCSPADPVFDFKQLDELAKQTGTSPAEWGYPMQSGIEVRASAKPDAPVVEKLGMHFIRVMEPDSAGEPPADRMPMLKVVAPSGKVGYVPADAMSPLGHDQLCYVKQGPAWRIGGFVGGEPE